MNPICGVYAIHGPNGVYVGESADCWGRNTLNLAAVLGFDCGVIREMPGASRLARVRAEAEVAKVFATRGFTVLSKYLSYSAPQQYRQFRTYKPRQSSSPSRRNVEILTQVQAGMRQAEVARLYEITPQRVSEIVCRDRQRRHREKARAIV